MRFIMDIRKNKLPITIAFLVCFLVITLTFNANNSPVQQGRQAQPADISVGSPNSSSLLAARTIVLDAGHGGMDGGAVGVNGELEKDINLAIVKNLQHLLEFSGFKVILTRDSDRSMHTEGVTGIRNQKVSDMENRKAVIDSHPESLFFSIHQNRFTSPRFTGAQMFYTDMHSDNYKLAQILQDCFAQLQVGNEREVKLIDNELYLFKSTQQPAVLIECGFLSNPDEAARLNTPEEQKRVAFTIYKGIMEYLKNT